MHKKTSLLYRDPDTWLINIVINSGILLIHLVLMVLYILVASKTMVIANAISIAFYLFGYMFIKHGKNIIYFSLMFLEIVVHASIGCFVIGYDAGFQLWFFALAALYFYPQFSDPNNSPKRISTALSVLCIIMYFVLYFSYAAGVIPDHKVSFIYHELLNGVNSVAAFVAITFFTYVFASSIIRSKNKLDYQLNHDALTGLMNRYALHQVTEDAVASAEKTGEPFSIAMIDIDDFKNINDNYGYEFGDFVIYSVAEEIKTVTDDNGFYAGRYGGEKFLFVYTREPSSEAMKYKMEKFRDHIAEKEFNSGGQIVHITVSIGVARYKQGDDYDNVLKKADDNLYKAKKEGKNRIV